MPDLSNTVRWLEYEPDLLGNRESKSPFYFLLNGSLSKAQLKALDEAIGRRSSIGDAPAKPPDNATDEEKADHDRAVEAWKEAGRVAAVDRYSAALEGFVKLGEEPLSFDGKAVKTLRDYLDLVSAHLPGLNAFFEPYNALLNVNVLGGNSSFSSGRLSGGFTSTVSRRSGKGAGRTVAH